MRNDSTPLFFADNLLIEDGDRLIIEVANKNALEILEKLFQVVPLYIA